MSRVWISGLAGPPLVRPGGPPKFLQNFGGPIRQLGIARIRAADRKGNPAGDMPGKRAVQLIYASGGQCMPAEYQSRPNWALCYSKKTTGADWRADYTGVTTIDGQKYWVSIWEKTASDGSRCLSVNLKPKESN
jgi:hypothetical protein